VLQVIVDSYHNFIMKTFYVYGLFDPIENDLRYIGETNNLKRRFGRHLMSSKLKESTYKNNWIKLLLSQNSKPILQIFEEFTSEEDAFNSEIFYISYFNWLGCNLTNSTTGGEGGFTGKPSEQTLVKIKEINSKPKSEIHKKRISDSHLGLKPNLETKQKLSFAKLGSNNAMSKLDDEKVKLIKSLLSNSIQINEISKMFNVNRRTISDIKHGYRWNHIKN
jgi:predicted GIY-YIG superfamily endonuclease